MGLVVTVTLALVVWVVMWACGVKSFDAFLVGMVILVLGAGEHIIRPMLPGRHDD